MTASQRYPGGCLCGALRYEATGAPLYSGHCYCADCRKASGSGFVPFLGFAASAVTFSGVSRSFSSPAASGGPATRNFCPICGGLVFGGERGLSDSYTIYAGSLDQPADFRPTVAIFTQDRPEWALIPQHCKVFERLPR
ncbi:MAG TPA: GFA family protein [Steroidobacteraceae bacterium]